MDRLRSDHTQKTLFILFKKTLFASFLYKRARHFFSNTIYTFAIDFNDKLLYHSNVTNSSVSSDSVSST